MSEPRFPGKRWVRIMADPCAHGVWHRGGSAGGAQVPRHVFEYENP
ncbi:hypothetical protein [Roseomonas chloroacetimidivorans]